MQFYSLDISQNDVYILDITAKTGLTAPTALLFVENEYRAEYHGGSLNPQIMAKWILEKISPEEISKNSKTTKNKKKMYKDVSSAEFKKDRAQS